MTLATCASTYRLPRSHRSNWLMASAGVFVERLGIGIGVDHHEPGPGGHAHFGKLELARGRTLGHMPEVPIGWGMFERPIELPGEPVEWAADLLTVAVDLLELSAAVQAGVPVRLDGVGAVRRTKNDIRAISYTT